MSIRWAMFACICFAASAQAAEATRDWHQYPAVVQIDQPATLYALGDVHGDEERLVQLLAATHVISAVPKSPRETQWAAGKAVLVCTGDMIDKYSRSIEVIEVMQALQQSAARAGGRVIVTMGNHEAEFLAGHGTDKKAADFIDELTAAKIDPTVVAAGNDAEGIGQWLRNLPVAAEVGDWFFCHAGNTQGRTVRQIDDEVKSAVDAHGFNVPILISDDSLLEARMHPRPWWDWDGKEPELKAVASTKHNPQADATRLQKQIETLGAHHLVFGHQPGKMKFSDGTVRLPDTLMQKYDGLVFFIDCGMSRGVDGGRAGLLRINEDSNHAAVSAEYIDGGSELLWKH